MGLQNNAGVYMEMHMRSCVLLYGHIYKQSLQEAADIVFTHSPCPFM